MIAPDPRCTLSLVCYAFYTAPRLGVLASDIDRLLRDVFHIPALGEIGLAALRRPTSTAYLGPGEVSAELVPLRHGELIWYQRKDFHCVALLIECHHDHADWGRWVEQQTATIRGLVHGCDGFETLAFVDMDPWPGKAASGVLSKMLSGVIPVADDLRFSNSNGLMLARAPRRWWVAAVAGGAEGSKKAANFLLQLKSGTLPLTLLLRCELAYSVALIEAEVSAMQRRAPAVVHNEPPRAPEHIETLTSLSRQADRLAELALALSPSPPGWADEVLALAASGREALARHLSPTPGPPYSFRCGSCDTTTALSTTDAKGPDMRTAARIFISYSHQDEKWKERVAKQLGVLASEGLDLWDDRRIAPGADWEIEIKSAIANCDLALLLVSADFLNSDFILGQEVPVLLQRRQQEGIPVVPLILSPCAWTRIPWLTEIQARPKDGKPLSTMKSPAADTALAKLAGEIADLLFTPISRACSLP